MALGFRIKVFTEIISAMFNTVRTALGPGVDLNPGSTLRTMLEAAALQDAEQYTQIGKLLDLFTLDKTRGDDLDRRTLDFGSFFQVDLRRLSARQSKALVGVRDNAFTFPNALLLNNTPAGSTTFQVGVNAAAAFPLAGRLVMDMATPREEAVYFSRAGDVFTVLGSGATQFGHLAGSPIDVTSIASKTTNLVPIGGTVVNLQVNTGQAFAASGKVILDRETAARELLDFTRVGDVITITTPGGAVNQHQSGASVIQSTTNSDRVVNSGTEVLIPATLATPEVSYTTDESITLFDGDFQSGLKNATSKLVGAATIAATMQITVFRSPPFATAVPYNPYAAAQGRDREEDEDYIQRVKSTVQSIAGVTPLSLATKVLGLEDPITGVVVGFAQLLDAVQPGLSHLYITDGSSTFAPSPVLVSGREVLVSVASGGDKRAKFLGAPPLTVVTSPGLPTPGAPKIVQVGTAGATSHSYVLVAVAGVGESPSAVSITTTGNATLNGSNFNRLTWDLVPGATGYKVYRTVGGATVGLIATLGASTKTLDDTGLAGNGATPVGSNTTITNATAITPRIFKSHTRGLATSVGVGFLEDAGASFTPGALVGQYFKTDDNQFYLISANTNVRLSFAGGTTPSLGAYAVFNFALPPMLPRLISDPSFVLGDYTINDTTGEVELTNALVQYDSLVAADDDNEPLGAYIKSSGLIAFVQKVLNGDEADIQTYPGLKGPGGSVRVLAPTIVRPQFVIQALSSTGTADPAFTAAIKAAAERVVNALGIGQTVLLFRMLAAIQVNVATVKDAKILSPQNNISILAGQLPRITAADITVV